MKKNKIIAFILSVSFAASLCLCGVLTPENASAAGISINRYFRGTTNYISGTFNSSLPLIILEAPDLDMESDLGESSAASMYTVDSGADNRPGDEPFYSADVTLGIIKYENNVPRPKKDYFIFAGNNDGDSPGIPLQGFDSGDRWFLLGGAYDKSLIRNYLGYALAKRVLDDAPETRLCELLLKNSEGYEYQGVYLLVEGSGLENMAVARRTEHYWEGFNQTVVADGDAGIFVLQENWGDNSEASSMGAMIDTVNNMFNSTDTDRYLQYTSILDTESFYAYFLINELMANYDGMNESVYTYNPETKKISIGPVWNFEHALDNQKDEAMSLRRLKYQGTTFYHRMIIDSEFVNGLINVSKDNAAEISGTEIRRLVDAAVAEIGAAQERDWRRWQSFYFSEENILGSYSSPESDIRIGANGIGYDERGALMVETGNYYSSPEDAPPRIRQFQTYDQEIIKLKFYTYERPAFVRRAILLLKNQDDLLTQVNAYGQNSVWAILFLVGFILTIIIARRTAER